MLQNFRTGETREDDFGEVVRGGAITLNFLGDQHDKYWEIYYMRDAAGAIDIVDLGESLVAPVRRGYGRRFEAFIKNLAKRARRHDNRVSYWAVEGD